MKLYSYWRSSSAWRVRIGFALKDVPVELVPVHLVRDGGEHRTLGHAARNPMRQIPVLEVSGPHGPVFLTQSMAILDWLDRTYPEPPLLPPDPLQRAQALALAEVVNAGIQPLQNLSVLERLDEAAIDRVSWARDRIHEGLTALEALAGRTAGAYMVGNHVTMADICLVPQLYNARRFGCDLSALPVLTRIDATCAALPAFVSAHPDAQPDAPASQETPHATP